MGSRNTDGSRISHNSRTSRKRHRNVLVTDYTDDERKKRSEIFDPSKLNLALWMNGSDPSKFTVDAHGNITAWEASVGGVTFTCDLAFAPKQSKLNGLHAPLFNPEGISTGTLVVPTEGGMETPSNVLGGDFTLFVVAKTTDNLGAFVFGLSDIGNNGVVAGLQVGTIASAWLVQNGGSASAFGASASPNATRLYAGVERGISRDIWTNGARNGTNATPKDKASLDAMQIACVRVRADAQGFAFSGHIGEIIAINRDLTANPAELETFRAIHRYLANKWGTDNLLDINML
jgi:hypothetical protein